MKRTVKIGLACLCILVGISEAAQATNLITNGSFEDTLGSYGSSAPYVTLDSSTASATSIPGWTVVSGSVDWIDSYWQASNGSKSLDLAGYYQHGLIVSDSFATVIGQTYQVQFDMAGNPDQPYTKTLVTVSTGDGSLAANYFSFDQSGHTKDNMGWVTEYFDFVAAGTTAQLYFGDFTNPDNPYEAWGAALDNVSVTPVPEPAPLFLLGAGLAGLGIFRRTWRR